MVRQVMNRISSISRATVALSVGVAVGLLLVATSFQSQFQSLAHAARDTSAVSPSASGATTEHVILFVLEGLGQESLKTGSMPVLSSLVKDGSVTWSATAVAPARRLPTMASLVTGMPVAKHGITWNVFEFSRGYPRAPTVFDYLDLSGGRDSAIFYMDESLYQLAKPEPYTDY
ncbi:MAG: alkaline phosphatase family protein, partial [Nitrospira sp.]